VTHRLPETLKAFHKPAARNRFPVSNAELNQRSQRRRLRRQPIIMATPPIKDQMAKAEGSGTGLTVNTSEMA
jgi:hypothetical protein